MGRTSVGKNYFRLLFGFLVLVTITIQDSCTAAHCWGCDTKGSEGRSDDVQSTEQQPEETVPTDIVVSSNALDCLFRDPPQDTLVPARKDNSSDNNQQNEFNNKQVNNQETSSFKDGDLHTPQPPARWTGVDALVAIFFAVAGIWLIAATIYSITLLVLIRLQARGELDIYDEDLGRFTFCNGRFSVHFGCIVRRYAIQLERDYQRRLRQRYGNPSGEEDPSPEPGPIRIMTREERRHAVEHLLCIQPMKLEHISANSTRNVDDKNKIDAGPASPTMSVRSSQEGPVCSICLEGYETTNVVFKSTSCAHVFHKDCLMEWLERRNNTECPCCRYQLVSDEQVWETVKRLRKERWRQMCKENGYVHRFVQWMLAKRLPRPTEPVESRNSTTSMGSTSSEDVDLESPHLIQRDLEQAMVNQSRDTQGDVHDVLPSTSEQNIAEKSDSDYCS